MKGCNWDKYLVMFMCTNIQQNHAREGIISVKATGHIKHHFASLSEQIWADVWKIWEGVCLGIFRWIEVRTDICVPCCFECQE